ncbi:hypothetical protein N7509_011202 [Penicillium cosmopolitanum]|uniref:Uncharacterized protein n=1 Tax=Penicillium cosmopolitanum TaxID=1131564 RepID=A0A9W9VSN2_9EURO|nr:uncharacterized protein N7509_011202 [Penicillium cosmopolitanum]KAJ5388661.1 hypothetical protein N7509_011202 [Penicillium cosmopolitanum]
MAEASTFTAPAGQAITVKLINTVNFGPAQLHRFMAPPVPGMETHPSNPSFSFLLEHSSGRKLVFDLGIRKDYQNYAPKIAEYIPTTKYQIEVTKNVIDILEEEGIKGEDIEAVIWRRVLMERFKDAMLPGAPQNPDSPLSESAFEGRNLREIAFEALAMLSAICAGLPEQPPTLIHLCSWVAMFVTMGGIFRPSKYLPVPESILPNPCHPHGDATFCPGGAWEELQRSRGRDVNDPLFTPTFGHDIPQIIETIGKLQEADCLDSVFVIIAHDATVRDSVDQFPLSLNRWKEKGWAKDLKWAFLRDAGVYWKSKGVI